MVEMFADQPGDQRALLEALLSAVRVEARELRHVEHDRDLVFAIHVKIHLGAPYRSSAHFWAIVRTPPGGSSGRSLDAGVAGSGADERHVERNAIALRPRASIGRLVVVLTMEDRGDGDVRGTGPLAGAMTGSVFSGVG